MSATAPSPPSTLTRHPDEEDLRVSLDSDAVITGKLSFSKPTKIDGTLKGEVRCSSLLVIGRTAKVEGGVYATRARIEGTVRGAVEAPERLEITATGRVTEGPVKTEKLVLREGGHLNAPVSRE